MYVHCIGKDRYCYRAGRTPAKGTGRDYTARRLLELKRFDSPLKFTCPTGGCTVSVEVNAQVGGSTDASNSFAVCGLLDGNFMPPPGNGGCPYVGETLVDGGFVVGTFVFTQNGVHAGNHTLQSQIFVNDGALLANYSVTYRLYTP
jgi:hypothetical protein